jgi:amino acid transporter
MLKESREMPPRRSGSDATHHMELAKNSIGTLGIIFFVVAAAAPLTVVVAVFPVILGSGNGLGIVGTFVLVAAVLLVFSVGFVAMSRHVRNAGAFYAFITKGLGRPLGMGSASLVIFSYNAVQLGLYGGIGFYAAEYVRTHFGLDAPWWIFSFAAMAACLGLGVRHLEAGARVLAVLLLLETGIILLLDLGIVFGPGRPTAGFSPALFSPLPVFSGAVGVALMFAHAAFMGFEGTAIYSEEARDPVRTVPRATYIAVIFMGSFYALSAWLIVSSAGLDHAVEMARSEGGNFVFQVGRRALGPAGAELFQIFSISSMFASALTFHNNVARYLFSLGRHNIVWSKLSKTHRVHKSPYYACIAQTLMVGAVVAVFAILRLDPYTTLFTWFTGIGALGMIITQVIASLSVFVFFRRAGVDSRLWHTKIAPLLAVLLLAPFIYFAFMSLDVLLGVQGALQWIFLFMLFGSLLLGIAVAVRMKYRDPQKYAALEAAFDAPVELLEDQTAATPAAASSVIPKTPATTA